jgi:hypothetical protein
MRLTEVVMSMGVALGGLAAAVHVLDLPVLSQRSERVATTASCRAVNLAILAYASRTDTVPTHVEQVRPWVTGDVSAYRLVDGVATGPGCPTSTP